MVEIGDGWYTYDFTSYDPNTEYAGRCDGSALLSGNDRYVYFGNDNLTPTELVTALKDPIADGVWDEAIRGSHDLPDSAGELLRRPMIMWRCDMPENINLEVIDPERLSTVPITSWIYEMSGYYDGLKLENILNAGQADIIRVRNNTLQLIDRQSPITWGFVSGKLKYNVDTPTSDWLPNDLLLLVISNTRLIVNDRIYQMGEFYKTISFSSNSISPADIQRILGLTHENIWTTNVFDIDGNHVSTEIQLYDSAANADTHDGVTGLVAKYSVTVTYLTGKPVSILSKKV